MPKFYDKAGALQEVTLDIGVYRDAKDLGMTVPQFINSKYDTDASKYGTAFDQLAADAGLFLRANSEFGIRPPSLKDALEGKVATLSAGTVVRESNPASRIMFPAVFLEAIESALKNNTSGYVALFDSMVAINDTIAGDRFEQPVLNFSAPAAKRSQAITQLALPTSMLSITVADVARNIPAFSLGMEVSDQALRATSLDLVSLALARQGETERASRVDEYISAFLAGDLDLAMSGLSSANADTFDSTISSDGVLTHTAWIKFLRQNWRKRQIDFVMCDLAAAMAIENRTGKPTVYTDDPKSPRIDALARVINPSWQDVKIFLLEDGVIPANTIIGLDSRYAIRRVRNSEADYQAVEEFVLKRSKAMRFDFGEIAYRLFDDAWSVLNLVNT